MNAGKLKHRLPIRPDFDVEIDLPRDLTAPEAQRICRWLKSLAADEPADRETPESQEPTT